MQKRSLSSAKATNKKVLHGRETAARLIGIATRLFAEQGYGNTTTQQIIDQARVTKGALYHHFSTKQDLFQAVYFEIERQVARRIDAASATAETPWEQLVQGCFAYLEACQEPGCHRILRIDGPAVLGYSSWAKIDQEFGLDRLVPFLQHLADTDVIHVPSVNAFGRLITGAMNEATFWIAQHQNPQQALSEVRSSLLVLLQAVKSAG